MWCQTFFAAPILEKLLVEIHETWNELYKLRCLKFVVLLDRSILALLISQFLVTGFHLFIHLYGFWYLLV